MLNWIKWPGSRRHEEADFSPESNASPPPHVGGYHFSNTLLASLLACALAPADLIAQAPFIYPRTSRTNQVDDYGGTKVADPYRWLEDDNSAGTKAWVEAQNKVTLGYLEKIPERKSIRDRLTRLWSYERYGIPFKEGGHYFFTKNDGLQNQNVLYTGIRWRPSRACYWILTSSLPTALPR